MPQAWTLSLQISLTGGVQIETGVGVSTSNLRSPGLSPSPPEPSMQLNHRTEGRDVLVIDLRVANLDASNARDFRDSVQTLLLTPSRVVLDMTGVKFIDSSGLGALIACLRQMNARQGEFRLCGLAPTVLALFEMMRMTRVFTLHASLPEALAAMP